MLSAIIPTYTNDYGLFKLISQLEKIKDIEILIVDNKPNDEKKRNLKILSTFPKKKLRFCQSSQFSFQKSKRGVASYFK
jgi:glycosyltransferase involved in cell wall biosynthesis